MTATAAVAVRVHPVTLAFDDQALERSFRAEWARRSVVHVRIATLLGIVMYGGFGLLDLQAIPDLVSVTWAIRFGLVIPLAGFLLAASCRRWFVERLQALVWLVGVSGGLGMVVVVHLATGAGQPAYASGILLVAAYLGMFTRLRFVAAAIAMVAVILGYLASVVIANGVVPALLLDRLGFAASMALMSGSGAYAFERTSRADFLRERRLADALANVRELSGLIPICAWCKKIRDDDGYWRRLETYLAARSRASFSHGMCPDCYRTHGGGDEGVPGEPGEQGEPEAAGGVSGGPPSAGRAAGESPSAGGDRPEPT